MVVQSLVIGDEVNPQNNLENWLVQTCSYLECVTAKQVVMSGYRMEITTYSIVYWVLEADPFPGMIYRPYM